MFAQPLTADTATATATASATATATGRMAAALHPRYGDADQVCWGEVERPSPAPGQVLIEVHASSVNMGDRIMLTGRPWITRLIFGLWRPKDRTLGVDVAGVVTALGPGVTGFAVGDRVFGETRGAYAEFVTADVARLAPLPDAVSFAQAAALPVAGVTALQGLRDHGQLRSGQRVLINGASGGVGHFAIQVAKALGAHVTAVVSTRNAQQASALGADEVIDYTRTDFTQSEARYDLVLDIAGSQPVRACRAILNPTGRYVSSVGRLGFLLKVLLAKLRWRRVGSFSEQVNPADLATMGAWLAEGRIRVVVERQYPLEKAADALAAVARGPNGAKTLLTR